ncbi:MAG: VTT domain-containing protein [Deltaproteobacteria bacterium]|nr:VTT domain-containing protein [Deltaproteobacteria bacterium]
MTPSGLEAWVAWLAAHGPALSLPLLALASAVEYIVPPFPGDTVVLAGAVLAAAGGWPLAPVLLATTAGSLLGAWVDWRLGRAAADRRDAGRFGDRLGRAAGLDRILAGYRRWGPAFLAVNRFLPGIRALFFVAAGLARMPLRSVLAWAAVSALAWNALLLAVGMALGKNLGRLEELARAYATVLWILLGLAVVAGFVRWISRRRRGSAGR